MINTKALVLLLSLIGGVSIQRVAGETTPITAKLRHTDYRVNDDGTETKISETTGWFARKSDGSEEKMLCGKTCNGQYRDIFTHTAYNLFGETKNAVVAGHWQGPVKEVDTHRGTLVNGTYAVAFPLEDGGLPHRPIGQIWIAPEFGIPVRTDLVDRHVHSVEDMVDIRIGVEPESWMVSLAGFRVVRDSVGVKGDGK